MSCATRPPLQPSGQDWQQEALWIPLQQRWTTDARKAACALATTTDIHRIITRAKTGGAPGLDGIQYGVLKLLLRTPGGGTLLIMLTNITNTVLRSPALPEPLGKSEIVYFYKKGDPAEQLQKTVARVCYTSSPQHSRHPSCRRPQTR
jgi:acyl-CoA thioesterase